MKLSWLFTNDWQCRSPNYAATELSTSAKTVRLDHVCARGKDGRRRGATRNVVMVCYLMSMAYLLNALRALSNYFLSSPAMPHKHPCAPINYSLAKHAVNNLPSLSNTLQLKLVRLGCDSPSPNWKRIK